jgi:hypothetical protein
MDIIYGCKQRACIVDEEPRAAAKRLPVYPALLPFVPRRQQTAKNRNFLAMLFSQALEMHFIEKTYTLLK